MSLCFINMQGIVINTQGSCTHTPYLAKWKMRLLRKCIT